MANQQELNDIKKWQNLSEDLEGHKAPEQQAKPDKTEIQKISQWQRLAEAMNPQSGQIDEEATKPKINKSLVLSWLRENPNPKDEAVHDWADEMGVNYDDVEEIIYAIATDYAMKR